MQILLFLSALLAGLTGAFTGDRVMGVGGQHSETAITRSAEAAGEAVVVVVAARAASQAVTRTSAITHLFAVHAAPLPLAARLTTGRWLE